MGEMFDGNKPKFQDRGIKVVFFFFFALIKMYAFSKLLKYSVYYISN